MRLLPVLLAIFLALTFFSRAYAQSTLSATESATVTATVPERNEPDAPTLISPANSSTINSVAPTFIFNPSLGATVVGHYQLWIDGSKNTDHIPAYNLTITTNALTALTEGIHTWFIKAIGSNGINRNSATWTFTIDTTAPPLTLSFVAGQNYTGQPTLTTADRTPAFIGESEVNASVSIALSGSSTSVNLDTTAGTNGQFTALPSFNLPPETYTVSISASDPAGNTTSLPSFTLTITAFVSGFTIPLPSPLPDLTFSLPFLTGSQISEGLTAFPILTAIPTKPTIIWLLLILLLIHLYILNWHLRADSKAGIHYQTIYLYIFPLVAIGLILLTISGII